jgi:hypothetical protein
MQKIILVFSALILFSCTTPSSEKQFVIKEFTGYKAYNEKHNVYSNYNFIKIQDSLFQIYKIDTIAYNNELKIIKTELDSIMVFNDKLRLDILEKIRNENQLARDLKDKEEKKIKDQKEKEIKKSLSSLRSSYDDLNETTWYYNTLFRHYTNSNHVSLYMGKSENNKPYLRLMVSYTGDDWLFFDRVVLIYGDNQRYEISFNSYDHKKTDNDGGSVWEWIDVTVSSGLDQQLELLARSKNAKIIFSGKYRYTHIISSSEKKALLQVLNPFYKLTLY